MRSNNRYQSDKLSLKNFFHLNLIKKEKKLGSLKVRKLKKYNSIKSCTSTRSSIDASDALYRSKRVYHYLYICKVCFVQLYN